ncbi:MAG: Pycsar system effector family protein [bacterium]
MVRDIYEQGVVLARSKYRYLRVSYLSFMVGLILSVGVELFQLATHID